MYLPEWLKIAVEIMAVAYTIIIIKMIYDFIKEIINR
jgi:hypothetical protein